MASTQQFNNDANTIGLWHLDGTSGSAGKLVDSSTGGHNLSDGSVAPTAGTGQILPTANGASVFAGTANQYHTLGDLTTFPTGAHSIEFWFNPSSFATDDRVIVSKYGGVGSRSFLINTTTAGKMSYAVTGDGTNFFSVTSATTFVTGTWYYIACVFTTSTKIEIFVNGVSDATNTTSIPASIYDGSSALDFGSAEAFRAIAVNIYSGSLDEVRISNIARTSVEILAYYSGQPAIETDAVTAIGQTSAVGNGEVTSDSGYSITERGICWSTAPSPTTSSSKATSSGTIGVFSANITGLTAGTLYYVRAYVINANGTSYGVEVQFTSLSLNAYDLVKDIGASAGETYFVSVNITGTVGTVTAKLGTTGTSQIINAGAGVSVFSGTYNGLSGLIFTRSVDFNGTLDDVMWVKAPIETTVDWSLDTLSIITPINSSVFFKRIEDDAFNSFAFYRYLDLLFKDLDGYVTVTIRQEREDITTDKTKTFVVGNAGTGTVSPFQKKRISFLSKNQAIIIGLSNANLSETFSIAKFLLTGSKEDKKMFAPSKINSVS